MVTKQQKHIGDGTLKGEAFAGTWYHCCYEDPADVCGISTRNTVQGAVLKFAAATDATPVAGRFTPGTFTNRSQAVFRKPRLLVVTDSRADHPPLMLTCLPLFCVTQTLLCAMWTWPSLATAQWV